MSVLREILRHKKKELRRLRDEMPLAEVKKKAQALAPARHRLLAALKKKRGMAVIAEIKRRSPSKGLVCRDFDPVRIARQYKAGGAAAISVLTDARYFGGSPDILRKVRKAVSLPILRKDFTVDEYQVYETRLIGADAVLLIAAALSSTALKRLAAVAEGLGLDVLYEVHTEAELRKVLPLKPKLLGVNNRDLRDFRVDLATTENLAKKAPKSALVVSESGIAGPEHIARLRRAGAAAFLVGETLMKEKDPGAALKRLLGKSRDPR